MLLHNAVKFSWQDGEYPGSLSTRMTAGKGGMDKITQWSGAAEKQQRGRLNKDNADFNPSTLLGQGILHQRI